MQKISKTKSTLLIFAAALLVIWSISSIYVVANNDFDNLNITRNSNPGENNLGSNVVGIIEPPLGNNTNLPPWYSVFTYMVMNLPFEITIVFSAELIVGSALKLDQKKLNMKRLGIMLGSSAALSVFMGVIQYFLLYPAIHDLPIHNKTYIQPGTGTEEIPAVYLPQYGGAPTFYSEGVDYLLLIVAAILILGLHFLAFKYIQNFKYLTAGISLIIPLLVYPLLWNSLTKQVTENKFLEKYESIFFIFLLVSLGYIAIIIILFLWKLSLTGSSPQKAEITPEQQYEGK